jgi:probable 2-oxoglutarate dehydrogenase E1 component DHKTD1
VEPLGQNTVSNQKMILNRVKHSHTLRHSHARFYHDKGVYGCRELRPIPEFDYTNDQIHNRVQHANLVRVIDAFRNQGHRLSNLDPLKFHGEPSLPRDLDLKRYQLNLKQIVPTNGLVHTPDNLETISVSSLIEHLNIVYCGKIGVEFMHLPNGAQRDWFAKQMESTPRESLSSNNRLEIWKLLAHSEVFDQMMQQRFPNIKRYGLEGSESTMVALNTLFRHLNIDGVNSIVLGMPHRGRLNLLVDLLKYPVRALFHKVKGYPEFAEDVEPFVCGDVLSHLVSCVDLEYNSSEPLHISMLHNPSHLESINPVSLGKARAKQMYLYDEQDQQDCYLGDKVCCVQIHGDAAFTGQGVVMETLGLSNLAHFRTGGSIHIIVNNQIGYTTEAVNSRSSIYVSDVAKCVDAPAIHVNGDYPEQVLRATQLAVEYRQKFRRDVVLDIVCLRRWGHNEMDEPAFTQPLMYKEIRSRKSVPRFYEETLLEKGILTMEQAEEGRSAQLRFLEEELKQANTYRPKSDHLQGKWKDMIHPKTSVVHLDTGVSRDVLVQVGNASVTVPSNFQLHNRLNKFHVLPRFEKMKTGKNIDWSTAEALALGSLLKEGYHVRISGQDVGRGTFSQRHMMLVDQNTENVIVPLDNFGANGRIEIANSSLSEMGVLGFEYGVSLETPKRLCIWEAQFGDFVNGATIMIDNFLVSAEAKWLRQSGMVLLLPHGLENGGPEHSSARPERFLQLVDDDSINVANHVVYPTTPAQYFHVLRRQMLRNFRRPLIVLSPKSLLRLGACQNDLSSFEPGTTFLPVIDDVIDAKKVNRVVFLSGKLYYELIAKRKELQVDNVALIRIEELCPFPTQQVMSILRKYDGSVYYAQEEPANQGAFNHVSIRLNSCLEELNRDKVKYIGRRAMVVPSTGVSKWFKPEQDAIVSAVFKVDS